MNTGQKLLVKSLILFSFVFAAAYEAVLSLVVKSLLVFEWQIGCIFKVCRVSALPNPNHDAYEYDETKNGG